MSDERERYLEVSVVARGLNVSPSTVYRLIQKKKLEAGRYGVERGLRVTASSVEAFKVERSNYE